MSHIIKVRKKFGKPWLKQSLNIKLFCLDLAISQGVYSLEEDRESLEKDCDEDLEPFYREFKQHKRQYYSEKFNVTVSDVKCNG